MKPFLTKFAVPRTQAYDLPGRYNPEISMWEIDSESGPAPLIRTNVSISDLETKTFAEREKDDQLPSRLAELQTKTDAAPESEDRPTLDLEIVSKRLASLERDDNRWMSELLTKTEQAREKDEK